MNKVIKIKLHRHRVAKNKKHSINKEQDTYIRDGTFSRISKIIYRKVGL